MILFYIQYPLANALQALGQNKTAFKISIISSILKLLSITVLSFFKLGMYTLILSIMINLVITTYLYYIEINKTLNN